MLTMLYHCVCEAEFVFHGGQDRVIAVLISIYAYHVADLDVKQMVLSIIESMQYSEDMILLLVNSIQKDLSGGSVELVCFSLKALVNIRLPADVYQHLVPRLLGMCNHGNICVRKHAIMTLIHIDKCIHCIGSASLEMILRSVIVETDLELLPSTLNLLLYFCETDIKTGSLYLAAAVHILDQIIVVDDAMWMYHKTPLPWCQLKILKYFNILLNSKDMAYAELEVIFGATSRCFEKTKTGVDAAYAILEICLDIMLQISNCEEKFASDVKKYCKTILKFAASENSNMQHIAAKMLQSVNRWQPSFCTMFQQQILALIFRANDDDSLKSIVAQVLVYMLNRDNCEVVTKQALSFARALVDLKCNLSVDSIIQQLFERLQNLKECHEFKVRVTFGVMVEFDTALSMCLAQNYCEYLHKLIQPDISVSKSLIECLSDYKSQWPRFSQRLIFHILTLLFSASSTNELKSAKSAEYLGQFLLSVLASEGCTVENFVQATDSFMHLLKCLELRDDDRNCFSSLKQFFLELNVANEQDYVKGMALSTAKKHVREGAANDYIPFQVLLDQSRGDNSRTNDFKNMNEDPDDITDAGMMAKSLNLEPYPIPTVVRVRGHSVANHGNSSAQKRQEMSVVNTSNDLFKGFM